MYHDGHTLTLSATDLSNFLGCHHRTALEMEAATGLRERPHFDDPLLDLLFQRGDDHEKAYVDTLRAKGLNIVDLNNLKGPASTRDAHIAATLHAMRTGADIIVQGALRLEQWFGMPDLLRRVSAPSYFGDWSYEIADTKLARETKVGTILQLVLYSRMLTDVQGVAPEHFHVITPDPEHSEHHFRLKEYAAFVRLVEGQLATSATRPAAVIAHENYPEPVEHCHICPWTGECKRKWEKDDHLSLVAGITRTQRKELETRDTRTLTELANLPLPVPFRPSRGSVESFNRAREQARLQLEAREHAPPPPHELRDIKEGEGLSRLPEPSPGDLFLDLEGDNLAIEGGREYLFGIISRGEDGTLEYTGLWASNDAEERTAFETVMDRIVAAIEKYPDMHVYHYAPYEVTAFKRLMGRYVTRENELDGMLREGRFVDLYAVVRQGLLAGVDGYSIKDLEPLYGFTRDVQLPDARKALRAYEYALATSQLANLPRDVGHTVERYNRDDCVSTLELYEWLEAVRANAIENGATIPRPTLGDAAPNPDLKEWQLRVADLRARLLDGIKDIPPKGTAAHGRWLLAYLLDFHRRENKSSWWRYFKLRESADDDLLEESDAIAGLRFVERVKTSTTKNGKLQSVVDRYSYPLQECEIRPGDDLHTRETSFGELVALNRGECTIDVKKGKKQADVHPTAVFAFDQVPIKPLEPAIAVLGEAVAAKPGLDGANGIARTLLQCERPRLTSGVFEQLENADTSTLAVETVHRLDHTVLPIQGPPGSGKTYTGARMICSLVERGKRVGVTGPSHKAIVNLLREVHAQAQNAGQSIRIAHKTGDDGGAGLPEWMRVLPDNKDVDQALAANEVDVLGGTSWLWARSEMSNSVDVLFVDEAGQVSLANAIAVSAAASSMVLLGDPQQLDQVQQGSHSDGVDASALQHMLGDDETIPRDRGIFLPETWRLAPSICTFTSELFYEGRLASKPGLERQALLGIDGLVGSGLWYVDVEHEGRTSASDEEVEVVARLVDRLTAPGASWLDEYLKPRRLGLEDILIVSPFNAQVSRLIDRLPKGARVGTVDKFQGQAAPVVIYSMASSSPEDAPRGMEFLYSLNRFNVATSRAKCAAIVVASPRLYEPECRSPRQMKLANALCRYRELGRAVPSIYRDPMDGQ